ncbi:MAG: response regulator, partial [Thermoanaerobaculia bacterium]
MSATAGPTILIIDDEVGILETIRILLKNEGFTPHTALGGKKGLEQIAALKPQLILTDVRMPDVTGLDILASVRSHDPDAVVILM